MQAQSVAVATRPTQTICIMHVLVLFANFNMKWALFYNFGNNYYQAIIVSNIITEQRLGRLGTRPGPNIP